MTSVALLWVGLVCILLGVFYLVLYWSKRRQSERVQTEYLHAAIGFNGLGIGAQNLHNGAFAYLAIAVGIISLSIALFGWWRSRESM